MLKSPEILGLGEIVVDWVAQIPHFPKPDEKVNSYNQEIFGGGVTANFLVATSRLGTYSGFIGAVGCDENGKFLIKDLKNEGVDTKYTYMKEELKTPVNFIVVASNSGEKFIIQSPYMQYSLSASELDSKYIGSSKLLHTTAIHHELTEEAIKIAKKNNVKVSLDLESQIAIRGWEKLKNIIKNVDILLPNKEGAKSITLSKSPKDAANILIKKGVKIVIITLGSKGALITTEKFQKIIPAYKIDNIVDTTGAGDTFIGAFSVAYWIKGWDLEKAVKYANGAAALKITKLGARTGMPTHKKTLAFLEERNESSF
jgi:ribokinase